MTPATMLRAAALLEREAESIRRSEQSFNAATKRWRWPTHTKTNGVKADHDEMLAVAAELRKGAA